MSRPGVVSVARPLAPAVLLVALAVLASRATVFLDLTTPLTKVEALNGSRPAGILEARGNTSQAGAVGLLALVLIVPVR